MAYIAPNTTIYICKGVPLDNTYKHTLYFSSASAQQQYFSGKVKTTLSQYTYQRNEAYVRAGVCADDIFDCNYLMFQNTAYGSKWWYAFITDVRWVNNEVSEIYFEIDNLQSYLFDVDVAQCYVEREHSVTDAIGDNLLADNLPLGDHVQYGIEQIPTDFTLPEIVVAATFDENFQSAQGHIYGGPGTYSGLHYNVFQLTQENALNAFIEQAVEKNLADGIVAIYITPGIPPVYDGTANVPKTFSVNKVYGDFDGYTPKNNKLYTYPYNYLYVYCPSGVGATYAYEYFSTNMANFEYLFSSNLAPDITIAPLNYKGFGENFNEKITITGYPQCPYNIDTYKAWLAQNGSAFITGGISNILGGAVGMVGSALTGNVIGAVSAGISTATNIAQDINTINRIASMPDHARGSATGGSLDAYTRRIPYFQNMRIRREYAEIIDNYWTMYGYPCRRVKTPNISARPGWNYTRTIGCTVLGEAPSPVLAQIGQIYDRGITFWKNPANVGNYSGNNSV